MSEAAKADRPLPVLSSEGLGHEAPKPRTPKGVVAVLVGADGVELANAAAFGAGTPAGFSRQEFQESQARRSLALATMRALASPRLSDAIEAHTAEQIMRAMCNQGCRVILVPVGYEQ